MAAAEDDKDAIRHELAIGIVSAHWSELEDLEPLPVDAIALASGGFGATGFGFELAYRYRVGSPDSPWWVGGEFVGLLHENEGELVARNLISGETSTIELNAVWGHLTGGFRYLWRSKKKVQIVAGAGVGLYLLRITESHEGFGVADRSESDSSPGGYATAGVRFPFGRSRWGVRLDGRLNFVTFEDFGSTFAGQSLEGPVGSFVVGADYRF